MLSPWLTLGICVWLTLLIVVNQAELPAFYYWLGAGGAFLILTFASRKYCVWLLASLVSRGAGWVGQLTHSFTAYPFPALIAINTHGGTLNLLLDYECSGIIEMNAYLSLLIFFPIYNAKEKIILGTLGSLWLYVVNVARVVLVGCVIHFFNLHALFWVHNVFGRLLFYILTIWMYYTVFTHSKLIDKILGRKSLQTGA